MERMQDTTGLISPPPEEALQIARTSVSKRKRTTPQSTPNPKPRKQTRPESPVRTRRTTPIPAYEPPSDVFTPPRVVIKTPTISKSSKRKTTNRRRASTAELTIKTEPPQIDLSAPMPPASPTDDPILLSAASSSPIRPRTRDAAVTTDPSLCVWSDDDDDDDLAHGEYTGSFRSFNIRTKRDPPSSATRDRQEEWGRPITPFPFRKIERLHLVKEEDEQEQCHQVQPHCGPFDFDTSFEDPDPIVMESYSQNIATEQPVPAYDVEQQGAEISIYDIEKDSSFEEAPALVHDEEQDEDEADTSIEEPTVVQVIQRSVYPEVLVEQDDKAHTSIEDAYAVLDEADTSVEGAPAVVEQDDDEADTSIEEPPAIVVEQDDDEADTSIEEPPAVVVEQDDNEADTSIDETPPAAHDDADEADEREVREMSFSLEDDDDDDPIIMATPPQFSQTEADEDSSSDEEELEYGLVKISSADPHAAARAAAILKQHDYDCFTRLALRTQKGRHSLSASGITKTRSPRRRTLGASVIGDKVFIPGSPLTTLPQLLKEAEATIAGTPTKLGTSPPHLFTPVPRSNTSFEFPRSLFENPAKERAWTKEEWKLLDACFTDERIALGPGDGQLASVDRVDPENVARRFEDLLGGADVINKWGEDWEIENLVQRVKALQKKQRNGIVAPPTTPNTPRPSSSLFTHRFSSVEVPDFTPLKRGAAPPGRRPTLPPPIITGAPFNDYQDTPEPEQEKQKSKLPLPLLAPRYSHLLEEAVAVSQLPDPSSSKTEPGIAYEEAEIEAPTTEAEPGLETVSLSTETAAANSASPNTLKTRVKGFIFSYLPTLSKKPTLKPKSLSSHPGLPLPPPSVLEKCRAPITTPARAPMPKPTHPKELVHLNPAPVPKPSLIPRPQKPQRLVELHRVSPPPEKDKAVIRSRRSSASSVKDLVRGFEELEKNAIANRAEEQKRGELKKVKSIGDWRKTAGLAIAGANGSKPSWRP